MYWAVEKNHTEIVKLLLDNDADMEICTKDGDTPLMRAVRNRHEMVVRMLLDKGARVSVFDKVRVFFSDCMLNCVCFQ